MSMQTKVRKIGNSYGIILSQEALSTLHVKEGDSLYLTEAPGGKLTIHSGNPSFEEKMRIAEECMDRYRNALTELAK